MSISVLGAPSSLCGTSQWRELGHAGSEKEPNLLLYEHMQAVLATVLAWAGLAGGRGDDVNWMIGRHRNEVIVSDHNSWFN